MFKAFVSFNSESQTTEIISQLDRLAEKPGKILYATCERCTLYYPYETERETELVCEIMRKMPGIISADVHEDGIFRLLVPANNLEKIVGIIGRKPDCWDERIPSYRCRTKREMHELETRLKEEGIKSACTYIEPVTEFEGHVDVAVYLNGFPDYAKLK